MSIPSGYKGSAAPLSSQGLGQAALLLKCSVPAIRAVWEVETGGKPPFDSQGRPRILFESAKFSKFTDHRYDVSHPDISKPSWVHDYGSGDQYDRLKAAAVFDYDAALKATSWGAFQVMGFNYGVCGFTDVQQMIQAMCDSADQQLLAFTRYCLANHLGQALADRDWKTFALRYNGAGQVDMYAAKLTGAYNRFAATATNA